MFALATAASAIQLKEEEQSNQVLQTTVWGIEGFKGFYDGFYHDFYHTKMDDNEKQCLDDDTVTKMADIFEIAMNPTTFDMGILSEGSQVFSDIMACHFEKPVFDLLAFCKDDAEACTIPVLTENLSKNVFSLIGKVTELAELVKGFPSKDDEEFKLQMRTLGSDFGFAAQLLFNYHK
eukprot:CAMPEP_0170478686 /NCGR_PEP_ID=MMETSP0208-20121228/172_1 /TAXON_ID=197538 /ORGANISM="Strombidium inclinatum, Strain S3" /LENGTH=177 /DNA_ID=CAMNT_0010750983 /DNA_START=49 /DNA_END=582 /DNA_ORIENTATION=-